MNEIVQVKMLEMLQEVFLNFFEKKCSHESISVVGDPRYSLRSLLPIG